MIVVRRVFAILISLIFFVSLVAVLLIWQVNSTVGNPKFYTDQLEKADIYNFIYDDVLPVALEEIPSGDESDLPVDISEFKDDLIPVAKKIIPSEWLQTQVESIINTAIPYAVGDTDDFTLTITIKDRIENAKNVIVDDVLNGEIGADLYDSELGQLADMLLEKMEELPFSISMTKEELQDALETVFPLEWIAGQVEEALDSTIPFITGDTNSFSITIDINDRIDPLISVMTDLVSGEDTLNYLIDDMLLPMFTGNLGDLMSMPYGIEITEEELSNTVKAALPPSQVQQLFGGIINAFGDYVKGESDSISVTLDLSTTGSAIVVGITDLIDQKLETVFDDLPECSLAEFNEAAQGLPSGGLPECRPTGYSYSEFKTLVGIDIGSEIGGALAEQIPAQFTLSDAELMEILPVGQDFLLQAREWGTEGFTFTDADLLENMDAETVETIGNVREWISSGYSTNITELMELTNNEEASETLDTLNEVRGYISLGRSLIWLLWLLPAVLLFVVAVLGGRGWKNKLLWAMSVLLVASLLIVIGVSVGYSGYGQPMITDAIASMPADNAITIVASEKGVEMIYNFTDSFVGGIRNMGIIMIAISGVVILGTIGYGVARSRGWISGLGPEEA
jgi:hypothetical protein